MGKNKNPDGEHPLTPENEALPKAIERRLAALENSISALEKNALERHAKIITWIFSAVAFVVGVSSLSMAILSSSSRSDSRAAATEMKQDVKDKLEDVEKRFQVLAGESLKKPLIQISTYHGPLDEQVVEAAFNSALPIYPIFLKNIGDKTSDNLSIRLYASAPFMQRYGGMWQQVDSNDKEYPVSYRYQSDNRMPINGIAPQETWNLSAEEGSNEINAPTNMVQCKLLVFYGGEKPAEAKFVIKLK